MDGRREELQRKFDESLKAAAAAAVELQRAMPEFKGTPHYSVIELAAHEAGVKLSRLVQSQQAALLTIEAGRTAKCPGCGKLCDVTEHSRTVKSIDGDVPLTEAMASCSRCERSFFPSTQSHGL